MIVWSTILYGVPLASGEPTHESVAQRPLTADPVGRLEADDLITNPHRLARTHAGDSGAPDATPLATPDPARASTRPDTARFRH